MRLRIVRGADLSEPHASLALLANRHVHPGRRNQAASGKKIRGLLSSKSPERSGLSCNARLKAIRFSCNSWQLSINTTNIETKYPTKADAATRKPRQSPPEIHSAVILESFVKRRTSFSTRCGCWRKTWKQIARPSAACKPRWPPHREIPGSRFGKFP